MDKISSHGRLMFLGLLKKASILFLLLLCLIFFIWIRKSVDLGFSLKLTI